MHSLLIAAAVATPFAGVFGLPAVVIVSGMLDGHRERRSGDARTQQEG